MDPVVLLSLITFLPLLGALVLACVPGDRRDALRCITLATTALVLAVCVLGFFGTNRFDVAADSMQAVFHLPWIESFGIYYCMGVDGISFPLVMLTALVCFLAMGASWTIEQHVKAYCILFLLLETGMLGVFLALDFFLFYVFWEVMLLPMYFLIGVWGGPRREYAAIKFFLYTLAGSVLILIALLLLYFHSDLRKLAAVSDLAKPRAAVAWSRLHIAPELEERLRDGGSAPVHTFNLLALAAMGQHTDCFDRPLLWGWPLQVWAFLLLFLGFIIKVPSVPLHTWLPDAHVEAPTPISMILAGVLLKMGGYGFIRICYPVCPQGGYDLAYAVCLVGVISMVYGALAAMAQTDFKRLVAYSSVSHMGYVVLGLGVWSARDFALYNADYWNMGVQGAMFQMIAHGISSSGMFFLVGVVYDRVHHRNLDQFGGLFARMPVYTGLSIGIFFAALGLPGLCGFVGEILVLLAAFQYDVTLAVVAASVAILTAGYILWAVQRVYLGPSYKGPHGEALTPSTPRENAIALVLFVAAILLGVLPRHTLLRFMEKTIERQVNDLADWTWRREQASGPGGAARPAAQLAPLGRGPRAEADRRPPPRDRVPRGGPGSPPRARAAGAAVPLGGGPGAGPHLSLLSAASAHRIRFDLMP